MNNKVPPCAKAKVKVFATSPVDRSRSIRLEWPEQVLAVEKAISEWLNDLSPDQVMERFVTCSADRLIVTIFYYDYN